MKKFFFLSLSTGLGLGYSPVMPGTTGAVAGFFLVYLCSLVSPLVQIVLIILSFFAGVWICNNSLSFFEEKDPGTITIDEIVSIPVTFFLIPVTPATVVSGFVLNRILDIIKPYPAFQVQSLKKGWGIMADDMITGIYSNIILHVVFMLL